MIGKIVLIREDGDHQILDWEHDSLHQMQKLVNGCIEIVKNTPHRLDVVLGDNLSKHLVAVVNDCGMINDMKRNGVATWFLHYPYMLFGPAILMRSGLNADGEPDLLPLRNEEAQLISALLEVGCSSREVEE